MGKNPLHGVLITKMMNYVYFKIFCNFSWQQCWSFYNLQSFQY